MTSRGEILRKTVHIGFGLVALLLRHLRPWQAISAAAVAVGFNAWALPRVTGRRLERNRDRERGYAIGIVLYPVSILILLLIFPRRPQIVAAAWGILAFGDGLSSVVGRAVRGRSLPWNPEKTVSGSLAFLLFGSAASTLFYLYVQAGQEGAVLPAGLVLPICVLTTLACAVVEGLPTGIDDNLTVPLTAAGVLFCLTWIDPEVLAAGVPEIGRNAGIGAAVNGIFAVLFLRRGWVDRSGAVAGFCIGLWMFAFGGWSAYVVLLLFFAMGTGATRIGFSSKAARGIAQEKQGARGAKNAAANCSLAAFLVFVAAAVSPAAGVWFRVGAAAALATAAFDTVSSEIGQLFRKGTVLITTLRRVPPGTEGAVSPAGTAAGIAAAGLLGFAAWGVGLLDRPAEISLVVAAGFVGATVESYLGATLEKRRFLDNETVNFLNTLVGALVAVLAGRWIL